MWQTTRNHHLPLHFSQPARAPVATHVTVTKRSEMCFLFCDLHSPITFHLKACFTPCVQISNCVKPHKDCFKRIFGYYSIHVINSISVSAIYFLFYCLTKHFKIKPAIRLDRLVCRLVSCLLTSLNQVSYPSYIESPMYWVSYLSCTESPVCLLLSLRSF